MKKSLLALSLVAALTPFASNAAEKGGAYIGAGFGYTSTDTDVTADSEDESDTGWKLYTGYRFNDYFALEGAYADLGEATYTTSPNTLTMEATTFTLAAVGIYPIMEELEIFAKLGLHRWDYNETLSGSTNATGSDDGTDLMFGLGLSYIVMDELTIRAEWEKFTMDPGQEMVESDVDMFSLGVQYNF